MLMSLKKVIIHEEGMVYAIEALRKDERCSESFNEQQMIVNCEKHYLYGDILLFFLSTDGTLNKIQNIEKMQHSVDKLNPYYSFSITSNEKDLFILFNDESSNTLKRDDVTTLRKRPLNNMKKAALELEVFDITGKTKSLNFTGNDPEGISFFPHEYKWLSKSELLLYSQKEKSYKFGVLMLD